MSSVIFPSQLFYFTFLYVLILLFFSASHLWVQCKPWGTWLCSLAYSQRQKERTADSCVGNLQTGIWNTHAHPPQTQHTHSGENGFSEHQDIKTECILKCFENFILALRAVINQNNEINRRRRKRSTYFKKNVCKFVVFFQRIKHFFVRELQKLNLIYLDLIFNIYRQNNTWIFTAWTEIQNEYIDVSGCIVKKKKWKSSIFFFT